MPKLVRLYIKNVLFGFVLSGVFVFALLYTNVANLWHLVSSSDIGWIAVAVLFVSNGVVFAGAHFAMTIMRMEKKDDDTSGGKRAPVATNIPARVEVTGNTRHSRNG